MNLRLVVTSTYGKGDHDRCGIRVGVWLRDVLAITCTRLYVSDVYVHTYVYPSTYELQD